jgi:drug/metabolite transporter (DMT)-like permease
VRSLSQGTLDLVYLAARLGLVRLVTGDRRPPLVLDDPFVTLDDDRARRALALLKEIARDFQVIYLTTSDRYHDAADAVVALAGPTEVDEGAREAQRRVSPAPEPVDAGLAVVVLGLASAIAWGAGDFGGGWTGRRGSVYGVAIGVDSIGVILALAMAAIIREPIPGTTTLLLAALAGVLAVSGIIGCTRGSRSAGWAWSRRSRASSPRRCRCSSASSARASHRRASSSGSSPRSSPSCWSRERRTRGPPVRDRVRPRRWRRARAVQHRGGRLPRARVAWPLAVIKGVGVIAVVAIVLIWRRPWRVPRAVWPALVATALLDLAGNAFYVLATQAGRLDVAAALSSLYPVTTVILAVVLLRERVSRGHLVGIVMAAVAIVLITGGSVPPDLEDRWLVGGADAACRHDVDGVEAFGPQQLLDPRPRLAEGRGGREMSIHDVHRDGSRPRPAFLARTTAAGATRTTAVTGRRPGERPGAGRAAPRGSGSSRRRRRDGRPRAASPAPDGGSRKATRVTSGRRIAPDGAAELVRREDLVRPEVAGRERALADAGRPDEHDDARDDDRDARHGAGTSTSRQSPR